MGRQPRVVQVTSAQSRKAFLHPESLRADRRSKPWMTFAQLSLVRVLFALELQRRSDEYGWRLQSNAVNPGYAEGNIAFSRPSQWIAAKLIYAIAGRLMGRTAGQGALQILFAATSPKAKMGRYYGPCGPFELLGLPGEVELNPQAEDEELAQSLWKDATEMAGVHWPAT